MLLLAVIILVVKSSILTRPLPAGDTLFFPCLLYSMLEIQK